MNRAMRVKRAKRMKRYGGAAITPAAFDGRAR